MPRVSEATERDYIFTVRVRFKALDDVAARERVAAMRGEAILRFGSDGEMKLQRVRAGVPPEKVEL